MTQVNWSEVMKGFLEKRKEKRIQEINNMSDNERRKLLQTPVFDQSGNYTKEDMEQFAKAIKRDFS